MLRFRPVDCATREPLDARLGAAARMNATIVANANANATVANATTDENPTLIPGGGSDQLVATFGYSNRRGYEMRTVAVYAAGPSPGWSWLAYKDQWTRLALSGKGVDGGVGGCFSASPGGRLAFFCVECDRRMKPFARGIAIRAFISTSACAATAAEEPPVYVGVSARGEHDWEVGASPPEMPCGEKANAWRFLAEEEERRAAAADDADDKTAAACGRRVNVPFAALNGCVGAAAANANTLFFELGRGATSDTVICLDEVFVEQRAPSA